MKRWTGLLVVVAALSIAAVEQGPLPTNLIWRDLNPNQSNTHDSSPNAASGGRVNGLAAASDKSVIFAATEWGGLYKSLSIGRSWSYVAGHGPMATWQVAVDPSNKKKVYATSFYDGRVRSLAGINVSSDGGISWRHPSSATPPVGFCDSTSRAENPSAFGIAINRERPTQVLVGTNCGLIASEDSGATWRHIYPAKAGKARDVWSIAIHDHGIIDICGETGHSRSTDGGKSWTSGAPKPLPGGRCSIAASPLDKNHLFATLDSTVYESRDGGQHWPMLNTANRYPDNNQGRIASIAVNPRSASSFDLWYGNGSLWVAKCTRAKCPVSRGRNVNGNGWRNVSTTRGAHLDVGVVLFDPSVAVGACPILMSDDGGIEVNANRSIARCQLPKWIQPDTTPHALWVMGMQMTQINAFDSTVHDSGGRISVAPKSTDNTYHRLYFGTQDNGSFQTNRANSDTLWWDNTDPSDASDVVGGTDITINSVCCYPQKLLFWRRVGKGGIMNDTLSNQLAMPDTGIYALMSNGIIAQIFQDHFAVLTNKGLFASRNFLHGDSLWFTLGWPRKIAPAGPTTAASLYVGNAGNHPVFYAQIYDVPNGPTSQLWALSGFAIPDVTVGQLMPPIPLLSQWYEVKPPSDSGAFGLVTVDRSNANRIFASYVQPRRDPRMVHSVDGGKSWIPLPGLDSCMTRRGVFRYTNSRGPSGIGAGKPGFTGYSQPTLVAYGTPEDSGKVMIAGAADAGVFISFDRGANWRVISDPLGALPVRIPRIPRPRFAYAASGPLQTTLYVGTQGRGVWSVRFPKAGFSGEVLPTC